MVNIRCFNKVRSVFSGTRSQDSSYSWIVCISAAVCNAVNLGTVLSFGVLFPTLMEYFDETRERTEKLSIATGVVALGSSVGVLYTGPLLQVLLDTFEWRYTFRIMASLYILVCIASLSFNPNVEEKAVVEDFKPEENSNEEKEEEEKEEESEKSGISLYCSVWTFPAYTVVVMSLVLASFGMYIPYINLVKYCEDIGISTQKGSQLFIFIGLASCFGRVMAGRLCNRKRVNPVYIYQACLITASLAAFMLPFATKYWILIAFSAIYGLSDGVFITTQCFILLTCVDSKRRTASFCILNMLYAFSAAAGGPMAALLADQTGTYIFSFYMTGGVLIVAFLIPTILICVNRGKSKVHALKTTEVGDGEREEKLNKLSKEVETDEIQDSEKGLRVETLTRKRTSSATF